MQHLVAIPGNTITLSNVIHEFDGTLADTVQPGEYAILNGSNVQISSGALFKDSPGNYFFNWETPSADIVNPYTVVWKLKTAQGGLTDKTTFEIEVPDVVDFNFSIFALQGDKDITLTGIAPGNYGIKWVDVNGSVKGEDTVTINSTLKVTLPQKLLDLKIGGYAVILLNMNTLQRTIYNLTIASYRFFALLPRFRTMVDRNKYNLDHIKAWREEHIYHFFEEGLALINRTAPTSNYNFETFPTEPNDVGLVGYLLKAAIYHGLRSAYLLENTLSFDYTGPNIDVNYDQMAGIEAEIGRLAEELGEGLAMAKKQAWIGGPVGVVSHRHLGARSRARFVRRSP